MEILEYKKFKENFIFVLNKSDLYKPDEKQRNLSKMCDQLGADTGVSIEGTKNECPFSYPTVMALGFPEGSDLKSVEKDLEKLQDALLEPLNSKDPFDEKKRIKVQPINACNIL